MERLSTMIRIGDWCVNPASGQISRGAETARLEVRATRLLLYLAEQAGEVVSIDELLDQVWAGVNVSPDSVYQAVASLRRLLGDDPKQPKYIETVPRLGYRMVAKVSRWTEAAPSEGAANPPENDGAIATGTVLNQIGSGTRIRWAAAGILLALALATGFVLHARFAGNAVRASAGTALEPQRNSIAVLPFLDLTEGMKEEEFADGMTEELIDKLSKVPGLQVPAPTSSFYFKGKQVTVADIAKTLGVAYVLDGSVRKSGERLRVAARLIHPCNGYVVWSETYDRPFKDVLMVQDDIAGEVTKALKASLAAEPTRNKSEYKSQ
ncbi:MAG TPA: winged helix-turn-helix domain-containing protein [Candidatus Sulfotelmatobacter sp.]|nr:winged helix-turn-helix domain-containing protein [Candidatus Sulfotelmatobacter sp.]